MTQPQEVSYNSLSPYALLDTVTPPAFSLESHDLLFFPTIPPKPQAFSE